MDYLEIAGDELSDGKEKVDKLLSEFSCKQNIEVENFLKEQSIIFSKKHQSVTYLVFSNDNVELIGYFTITVKPITVNLEKFSNTQKKKIMRVSQQNEENGTYTLSAYLIAQLAKNHANGINDKISGTQILDAAIDTIKQIQYMAGGMVVFLEAEDNPKLMEFYEVQNGFHRFDVRKTKSDEPHDLIQLLKVL